MMIGHYAVALGGKMLAPRTSLGTLVAAAVFLDLLWPLLLLLGLETVVIAPGNTAFTPLDFVSYPWSHSLLMSLIWSALFGGIYYALAKDRRGALVLALLVVSHWVLDFITHRPDMPLTPGDTIKLGLGLWNSVPMTVALELGLFALGAFLYIGATRAKDGIGRWGLMGFIGLLLAIYAGAIFGPPPPNVSAIIWTDILQVLMILFAWWVDRHRRGPP